MRILDWLEDRTGSYTVNLKNQGKNATTGTTAWTDTIPTGTTFASITDGLSNTAIVGEKHVPQSRFGRSPWDSSVYNSDPTTGPAYRQLGDELPVMAVQLRRLDGLVRTDLCYRGTGRAQIPPGSPGPAGRQSDQR